MYLYTEKITSESDVNFEKQKKQLRIQFDLHSMETYNFPN